MAVIIQVQLLTWKLVDCRKCYVIFRWSVLARGAFVPLKSCNTSVNAIGTYVAICQYDSVMHMHEGGCQAKKTCINIFSKEVMWVVNTLYFLFHPSLISIFKTHIEIWWNSKDYKT